MNQIDSKYFLDSSAWISYFFAQNREVKDIIDGSYSLFTSSISLFEIKRKLIRDRLDASKISAILSYIKEKSIIIKPEQNICEEAADISIKEKLHSIDSLIYISSQINNCILVIADNDFKNLKKVIVLK